MVTIRHDPPIPFIAHPYSIEWGTGEIECNTGPKSGSAVVQSDPMDPSNGLLTITAKHQPDGFQCLNLQVGNDLRAGTCVGD